MKRVFVIGATGRTGLQLVEQTLGRGHPVTAFVRSPEKLGALTGHPALRVVTGDPHDSGALAEAMRGHDAVLSALGPRTRTDDQLIPRCTEATIAAMRDAGVRRLLLVSSALLYPNTGVIGRLIGRLIAGSLRGALSGEALLARADDLAWTVVRPVQLTDAANARYRVFQEQLPGKARPVSRADVAHLLLESLERAEYEREVVGICR